MSADNESTQPLVATEQETNNESSQSETTHRESFRLDYRSPSAFVKEIDEAFKNGKLPVKPKRNETISLAHIWFKGSDTYTGKFDNYCVKYPVFVIFSTSIERNIKVDYQQLATVLNIKPNDIISFGQNWERSVPKGEQRNNIYELVIGFYPRQRKDGLPYYPTSVYREKIQSKINTIKKYVESEDWKSWTKTKEQNED